MRWRIKYIYCKAFIPILTFIKFTDIRKQGEVLPENLTIKTQNITGKLNKMNELNKHFVKINFSVPNFINFIEIDFYIFFYNIFNS